MAPESSAKRVIEDLRVELFRRRISQAQLAAETGMSQSAISRRLNGDIDPTVPELERIAAAAGLEVAIALLDRPALSHEPTSSPSDVLPAAASSPSDAAALPTPTTGGH